jgi:hypothetical protein
VQQGHDVDVVFHETPFGILAGLVLSAYKMRDTSHHRSGRANRDDAHIQTTDERIGSQSRKDRAHIVRKNADGDAWSLHC